jgi:NTP pyrophosphatase (non-canonical NTP hydrolase)
MTSSEDYWTALNELARVYRGERNYMEAVHFQITKLTEEMGEVAQAFIGYTGQNPRKGMTHSMLDVADEACDVIITAMVLLCTIAEDIGEYTFKSRTEYVINRARKNGLFDAT